MRDKPTYYCKRCRRYLRSNLCSLHGTEHTIEMREQGASRPSSPGTDFGRERRPGGDAVPLPPPQGFYAPVIVSKEAPAARKPAAPATAPTRRPVSNGQPVTTGRNATGTAIEAATASATRT